MTSYVLDSSAVLALLFSEPGKDRVEEILDDCIIGRINATEVLTKLVERGSSIEEAAETLADLRISIREFDFRQSEKTAELRVQTKHLGFISWRQSLFGVGTS